MFFERVIFAPATPTPVRLSTTRLELPAPWALTPPSKVAESAGRRIKVIKIIKLRILFI